MYEIYYGNLGVLKWYVQKLVRIMRFVTILLFMGIMQVNAATFGQGITLSQKKVSLEKIFREIYNQSGYDFIYDRKVLADKKAVDIQVNNKSIDEVLSICLNGQQLEYTIREKTVVVKEKIGTHAANTSQLQLSGRKLESAAIEKITITGTVTDTLGVKLPGVSILVANKAKSGTQTDANGKFVLDVEVGDVLRFSYVGYKFQSITVTANRQIYNVALKDDNLLQDVVITAFGKKERREALVGSVTSVKPGELKIPASNLTNALAGQVAGVIGYQRSGQPGQDNASFFIRGVTTFGYKQDPLILIDNIEVSSSELARMQVDDIASFSILKDASATSLYGARGGNGVILISTKEGKEGKPKISFRLENSGSQSAITPQLADPITYMKLFNEASIGRDPLSPLPFSQNKFLGTQATINKAPGSNEYVYPAVDWMKLLFKDQTSTQRANMNIA
ncbi:MAG: TonB-dependent receptor, partial [Daejeonella sp.]|nr:TonB-dependent receptor [Daejeonella sp.]